MPKSAVWAGESIDRFIPPQLRNTFYKNSNAQSKYARNDGVGAYDFPTNRLVLYLPLWALNNGGTNSIQSVDAYKHACAITGATWGIQGRTFDGSDDVITVPANNVLSPTDGAGNDYAFSIVVWARMTDATNFMIVSRGSTTTREFAFFVDLNDKLLVTVQDPTAAKWINRTSDGALTSYQGSFALLGATYSGSELNTGLTLYVNGVSIASTGGSGDVYAGMTRSANDMTIGRLWTNGTGYAIGIIGEVMMYVQKQLSASEMMRIYNATKWRYL